MSESHYIGLDVSARTVNLCVVDHNGRVAHERKLSSDPEEIVQHKGRRRIGRCPVWRPSGEPTAT